MSLGFGNQTNLLPQRCVTSGLNAFRLPEFCLTPQLNLGKLCLHHSLMQLCLSLGTLSERYSLVGL
jgi:hypothetical protein